MSYAFGVYLNGRLIEGDFLTRARAERLATALRDVFPTDHYEVRRVMVRDDNGRAR